MGKSTCSLLILLMLLVRRGGSRILCEGNPEDLTQDHKNGTIECNTNACLALWHTVLLPNNETLHMVMKKGCFQNDEKNELRFCHDECVQQPLPEAMKGKNVSGYCCCTTDLCNTNFTLKEYPSVNATDLVPFSIGNKSGGFSTATIVIVVFCVLFLVLTIIGAAILWIIKLNKKTRYNPTSTDEKEPLGPTMDLGKLTRDYLIGQGRYGTVWKGQLNGEDVAVKVFPPGHRQYWLCEKQLLTSGYAHSNILKFFAAEENQLHDSPEYLLVTEYHSRGSLLNFLKSNTVTWREMCILSQTAAAGVAFLHQDGEEDFVGGNKVSYVHRDINSRNLLVRNDKTCVLADFGFAMQVSGLGTVKTDEGPFVAEVGTLRYMAPEVLDGAVNLHDLQSALKQIDVYALALVIWEVAMRCVDLFGKETVPEYKLPFERELGPVEPENLHAYVVQNKSRPLFPDAWKHNHLGLRSLKETIEDSWDQDADARLTALCVQERLSELANHYPDGLIPPLSSNLVQPFQQNFTGNQLANVTTSQCNPPPPDVMVVNLSDPGKRRSTEVTTV